MPLAVQEQQMRSASFSKERMSFLFLPPHFITIIILIFLSSFGPVLCCYNSIFNFGDSSSDTGNFYNPEDKTNYASHLPYGETYFQRPTGRYSDGRLMIDFLTKAMGFPHFLPPYLGKNDSEQGDRFRYGANFAVVAATALSSKDFRLRGLPSLSNYTLNVQLGWFKELLPSLGTSDSDRKEFLSKSLFFVGEIGGNDFNYLVYQRKLDQIKPMIPTVIKAVGSAVKKLIDLGARTLVVPGNYPVGCMATLLTLFQSNSTDDYDHNGCIRSFNEFSKYYNRLLQLKLNGLRKSHPFATIVYADYYNATMTVYSSPKLYGFGPEPLAACCGADGPYNYNLTVSCGSEMSNLCEDPSKHICWDGVHYTEAAYKAFFNILLNSSYAGLGINKKCY